MFAATDLKSICEIKELIAMNKTGVVSISFRKYSKEEIAEYTKRAGLDSVEWGGDVHVPHGDITEAEKAVKITHGCGLEVAEYGSYYVIGQSEENLFDKVLASALALGTRIIRVWPGMNKPSDTFTTEEYEKYVLDAKRICALAKEKNLTVALECHPSSLTDEYHTSLKFLSDVGAENLKMMWQPNQHRPLSYNLDSIKALLPYIVAVHVFSWERKNRLPLAAKESDWKKYMELLREKDLNYMLELMHDDKIETLEETAKTLKSWFN